MLTSKQWKPTIKTRTAPFKFEGMAHSSVVMANFLGLEDISKFKQKK